MKHLNNQRKIILNKDLISNGVMKINIDNIIYIIIIKKIFEYITKEGVSTCIIKNIYNNK